MMRFFAVTVGREGQESREVIVPSKTVVQAGDAALTVMRPGEAVLAVREVEDDGYQHADTPPPGTQTHPDRPV
jgi:hypothetical protein